MRIVSKCEGELSVGFYTEDLRYNGKSILDDGRDWTFEGIIVAYADEIAQRHHDIEDGIYAGIIDVEKLCAYIGDIFSETELSKKCVKATKAKSRSEAISILSRAIVDFYVTEYIKRIQELMEAIRKEFGCGMFETKKRDIFTWMMQTDESKKKKYKKIIDENSMLGADRQFQEYLQPNILLSELAQSMDGKATFIIRQLTKAYLTNPQQLPDSTIISIVRETNRDDLVTILKEKTEASTARDILKDNMNKDDTKTKRVLLRKICDYIAGMTDSYALKQYRKLYAVELSNE